MRVTIKDVARAANVSPATVSLVMNNRQAPVSPATRERVLNAAREMRYRPNQMAVALTTRKTNTIGLSIPDITNLFHSAYCEQIERAAEKLSYSTIIRIARNDLQDTVRFLCDFEDRAVDGVILTKSLFADPQDTFECMQTVKEMRIPVMLTDRVPKEFAAGAVLPNDYLGGLLAVRHLIDLGHRQIGCITGQMHYENCKDRLRAYCDALEEAGIPYDPSLVFQGNWEVDSGMRALPYLLGKKVTGIFAFNDMTAYGVYKQARNYNLRIPEDISVVGYDDLIFSDLIDPPLTTLEYPIAQMAAGVVERLIAKINNQPVSDEPLVFDPILKVKGSTARLHRHAQP